MATPEEILEKSLARPKKGVNNMGQFEMHPLADQIKLADRLGANSAMSKPNWGIGLKRFNTPGTN